MTQQPEVHVVAEVHVVPYRDVWAVEAVGIKYLEFATQEMAIAFGRIQAEKKQAELFIHDRDGQVIPMDRNNSSEPQRNVA